MNIMIEARNNTTPKVQLKTALLKDLPESVAVVNEFSYKYLEKKHLEFMIIHMDFFYLCYGYYSNHSFMPIRTSVPGNSSIFKVSSFFMNDDHFVNHQKGKIIEFNQNEANLISRIMYRTI